MRDFILFVFLISLTFGCDQFDNRLTIVNNSDKTIYYEVSIKNEFENYPLKIDSLNGDTLWDYIYFLKPFQKTTIPLMGNWEEHINEYSFDKSLTVFFFDNYLLNKTSSDSLIKYQFYSKKIKYNLEELKKKNWQVVYDPKR